MIVRFNDVRVMTHQAGQTVTRAVIRIAYLVAKVVTGTDAARFLLIAENRSSSSKLHKDVKI